jgi:hypothetical protein
MNPVPLVNYEMPPITDEMFYGYPIHSEVLLVPLAHGPLMRMRFKKMKLKMKAMKTKAMKTSHLLIHLPSCFDLTIYLLLPFWCLDAKGEK